MDAAPVRLEGLSHYFGSGALRKQILFDLEEELDHFLDINSDTYFYPDVLLLKGRLLYEYLDRDSGVALLQSLTEQFSKRQEILDQVDELLNAR